MKRVMYVVSVCCCGGGDLRGGDGGDRDDVLVRQGVAGPAAGALETPVVAPRQSAVEEGRGDRKQMGISSEPN